MKLILFMVMSMDGIVAIDERTDIRKFSSKEDHDFFIKEAAACDAAVMGRFSYNRDVACKRKYLLSHVPPVSGMDADTVLLSGTVQEVYKRIEDDGNERVALLGGPRTNSAFFNGGYVDEIYLTVEPVILGAGVHFAETYLGNRWRLYRSIRLNEEGTVVQHYIREQEKVPDKQDRWKAILTNNRFQNIIEKLETVEKDRIFCGHGLTHLLDTARIMHIKNLEDGLLFSKDLVYAAGLLHDIGRLREYEDGTAHEKAAVPIVKEILEECGYQKEEQEMVAFAISVHREGKAEKKDKSQLLADLLFQADKAGRLCFKCGAWEKCNWTEERKNAGLLC